MTFIFTAHEKTPVKIDRGEAINRLIDAGTTLERAMLLIDALPCGFFVGFYDDMYEAYIERRG